MRLVNISYFAPRFRQWNPLHARPCLEWGPLFDLLDYREFGARDGRISVRNSEMTVKRQVKLLSTKIEELEKVNREIE